MRTDGNGGMGKPLVCNISHQERGRYKTYAVVSEGEQSVERMVLRFAPGYQGDFRNAALA